MRLSGLGWALLVPLLVAGGADAARPQPGRAVAASRPGKAAGVRPGKAAGAKLRRGKAQRRGRKKRREVPPQMPSKLELTAIDLVSGTAHLDVVGTTRPPVTQLFVFADQTGRRYAPSFAECHPPPGVHLAPAAGTERGEAAEPEEDAPAAAGPELPATTRWRCSLTIPRLYRRAPITGITMEWGRLSVAAPEQAVQRLWGEARALAPLSAIAERPSDPPAEQAAPRPAAGVPGTTAPPLDDDPGEPEEAPGDAPQDPLEDGAPAPRPLHAAE